MKKLHRARDFLAGALVMALALCLIVPAGAALTGKKIDVLQGIEIFVDGVKLEPKDANGKSVETFVYNGTTYVPLRAVSQSLGKNVKWDGANQRVYIGEVPGERQYLLDACPPYETNYGYYSANGDVKDGSDVFQMAGQSYTNGFKVDINRSNGTVALFNLNGKYQNLEFDLGHVDGTGKDKLFLKFYLDGELAELVEMTAEELPRHISIPLKNALQMRIESVGESASMWGSNYGLANIEVV